MTEFTGGCQCGAVRYKLTSKIKDPHLCRCRICQKAAGNYFMPLGGVKLKEFLITRGEPSWFHSSGPVRRGFCNKCGTSLFYYLKPAEQYHFPVGLLDANLKFRFSHQIFIDEKPDYYNFANKTQNMTGAEVFAHFESEQ